MKNRTGTVQVLGIIKKGECQTRQENMRFGDKSVKRHATLVDSTKFLMTADPGWNL